MLINITKIYVCNIIFRFHDALGTVLVSYHHYLCLPG